jgi:hypothetical protein
MVSKLRHADSAKKLGDIFAVSASHCRMRRDFALMVETHNLGKRHSPGAPLAVPSARVVVESPSIRKSTLSWQRQGTACTGRLSSKKDLRKADQ